MSKNVIGIILLVGISWSLEEKPGLKKLFFDNDVKRILTELISGRI
tara:strand:- start:2673 stop:2810 length:138 start_codon:yes stop_codon:yes gene_type:complete